MSSNSRQEFQKNSFQGGVHRNGHDCDVDASSFSSKTLICGINFNNKVPQRTEAVLKVGGGSLASLAEIRCLVLESNPVIFIDIEEILKSFGIENIDHVFTSEQAVAMQQRFSFSFAIIDLDPVTSGLETVLQELKMRQIKFAAITFSLCDLEGNAEFKEVPIITKPFSTASVVSAVSAMVPQRR